MTTRPRDQRTDVTNLVADELVTVLDYLTRAVSAGDAGNLPYMQDKVMGLSHAVRSLLGRLSETPLPANANEPVRYAENKKFDGPRLRALVASHGRHYRAARLLYPLPRDPEFTRERQALEAAATALAEDARRIGLTTTSVDTVTDWLRIFAAGAALRARTTEEG